MRPSFHHKDGVWEFIEPHIMQHVTIFGMLNFVVALRAEAHISWSQ